jgi:DNA-binding IclR family transcriptional regulator
LGLRLYELGSLYLRGASLYGTAASALPELSQQSGHTSYLGVLDGQDMVTLEMCPGTNPLQVVVSPGERIPAHVAAGGKAVLASLPESRLIELYPRKLPRFTRATIPTLAALKAELEAVRRRGYAVANGEWTESIASVGVSLRGSPSDRPIGVSLAFPAYRVSRREVEDLAELSFVVAVVGATVHEQ